MRTKNDALKAAQFFLDSIKKGGVRVSDAFLFGSYAHDTARSESDIDVAIVSPDFTGFRFDDLGTIAPYKLSADKEIEAHPFAEADFTADNPLAQEILEKGVRLI
jgi:predicted nucleotidyltransferase